MGTIFTAGHSTRSAGQLIELLADAAVRIVADVRRFPASRRHPQFNREALARVLDAAGIRYVWLGESLGGRRAEILPAERSPNRAWKIAAFRHYADALNTPELRSGLAELEELARTQPTVVLCAEATWWRCHRRLIADALLVRGWQVEHLLAPGRREAHRLTEFARVENGLLTYPGLL